MINLTEEAKGRFELYLRRTRAAMRGTGSVEVSEVEQNVREHVELALAGAAAPVGADQLADVLEQLGPPERWLLDGDRPSWRQMGDRLMQGPEDWRLAYLSFALTVLSILLLPFFGFLLLVPAFFVSRAWIALMNERGEPLDARRWLVLPPILLAFVLFIGAALAVPIGFAGAIAADGELSAYGIPGPGRNGETVASFIGYLAAAGGVWWVLLSGLLAFLFEPIRALFSPILDSFRRRHLYRLTVLGAICAGVGTWVMSVT